MKPRTLNRSPLKRQLEAQERKSALGSALTQTSAVRSIDAAKGLLAWNYFNFGIPVMLTVLPPHPIIAENLRYLMLSILLCAALSWWKLNARLSMPWAVGFILLLQVWLTICSFLGTLELGRTNDFETSNYFIVMAVMLFFQGTIFVQFWPELRRNVLRVFFVVYSISSFVAILQFLKIGPALQIAAFYNTFANITEWGGGSGVRAIGLASWPSYMTLQAMICMFILLGKLFERPLKTWELCAIPVFLAVGFMAQSRILYVSLLLAVIGMLYMIWRYERKRFAAFSVGLFLSAGMMLIFASDRLAYALGTDVANDPTLTYRRDTGWQQAFHIYSERPWFGIGPDNRLVWDISRGNDQWSQGHHIDNGYLLMLSWGGLPAVAIFIFCLIFMLGGVVLVLTSQRTTVHQRQVALIAMVSFIIIFNDTILNNGFTNIWVNCILAYFCAMLQPTASERVQELKNRLNVRRRNLPAPTDA